jgi:hypothetical protein
MAGLLPHTLIDQQQGLRPDQVANEPYMLDSNPILDLLMRYFQETEGVAKPGRLSRSVKPEPEPTPDRSSISKRMRETDGPIQAKTAKRHASKRDRLTDELDDY